MKANRVQVYAAIDGERKYQDALQGNARRENIDDYSDLGSLIVFLDVYVGKAKAALASPAPENAGKALHEIRKVAAIAVRAMEYHGVLYRETLAAAPLRAALDAGRPYAMPAPVGSAAGPVVKTPVDAAVDALRSIVADKDVDVDTRIMAASVLLNRGSNNYHYCS